MSEQQTLFRGPRVSRVTIGRLHNLGNYEHVRYEVTVDLDPGTCPASVLRELEDALNGLSPKQPVSDYEVLNATRTLAKPEPTLADMPARDDDDPFYSPEQQLRRALDERETAKRNLDRYEDWRKARAAAHARFNQFGGTTRFTDAKDAWDDPA